MKKFILTIFGWSLVIMFFMIAVLYPLKLEFFAPKKIAYLERYADKNLDVLVLGSSRADNGFDPTVFGKTKIFNFGVGGSGLVTNYFMLKSLIETNGFHISKILFQVDEFSFNGSVGFSSKFKDDILVKDLNDQEVYEAFKIYRGPCLAFILKYFPKLANLVHNDFSKILQTYRYSFMSFSKKTKLEYEKSIMDCAESKGYTPGPGARVIKRTGKKTTYVLEQEDIRYFYKIVQLCNKNNIDLILYRAPFLYCDELDSRLFDQFIFSFSKKNKIPFYDYKCAYQEEQHYYDRAHYVDTLVKVFSADLKNKISIHL